MKRITITFFLVAFMNISFVHGQSLWIADGTLNVPNRYDLQPTLDDLTSNEREAVRNVAFAKEFQIKDKELPRSQKVADFELLDVAEGYFISREFQDRAYLYSAFSSKMKRSYQGLLVLGISNNGSTFTPKAHYVYAWRGDRYLRQLSDINSNFLSEIAIYGEITTHRDTRRMVRIMELSPNGVGKIGQKEIYKSQILKQRTPRFSDRTSGRIYSPPIVNAQKLSAVRLLGRPLEFVVEEWTRHDEDWTQTKSGVQTFSSLEADDTDYIEVVRPVFPKSFEK